MKSETSITGFTLIELMVTIAILAILISVAVPSFQSLIQNSELRAARSIIESAVAYARSESVARHEQVTICPSPDQISCAASTAWTDDIISFVDKNADGVLSTADCTVIADCVLRNHGKMKDQTTLTSTANTSTANFLAFDRDGGLADNSATALRVCSKSADATNDNNRSATISLSPSGSARSKKGTSECP